MSFLEDLDNHIIEQEANAYGINIEDDGFKIIDDNQAEFMLRRIAELNQEKKEAQEAAQRKIQEYADIVNGFANRKITTIDNTVEYFSRMLESYAREVIDENKKKSHKLAFGTISFKKQQPSFNYEEDILKEYLLSNDDLKKSFIKEEIKTSINKKDLKKNGNIIDGKLYIGNNEIKGVDIEELPDKFTINIK